MRFYSYVILIVFNIYGISLYAQNKDPEIILVDPSHFTLIDSGILPETIKEASGLVSYMDNSYWTHNDGGLAVLFCIDSTGNLIRTLHLMNKNQGWEDLTKDTSGNLYIGAFGNNRNNKKNLKIYKIPSPDSINRQVVIADVISYTYEDQKDYPPSPDKQNFDVDAFICMRDSLYLFTKNRTKPYNGIINIYRLPTTPGSYKAKKVDYFRLPGKDMISNWITGATISDDHKTIALLFHNKILLINNFSSKKISLGDFYQLNLNHYSHKAGICYSGNSMLMVVDELELDIIGGKIYKVTFTEEITNTY